ncbi:MAG: LOG family protein [Anaerolineales bacterium]|nr:LOG family protein [Anaerolineales bacterium]
MRVTVFGSASPKPTHPVYEQALTLGQLLARNGHTVLTGGYMGTMEAVSRGAGEAGGHVIGVTCSQIETWRPIKANPWVKEEWQKDSLKERLFTLIESCEAAMALPGGPGTLAEIATTWNLLIIGALPTRPLILIGDGWQAVFDQVYKSMGEFTPYNQRVYLKFAHNVQAAVEMLANKG